MELLQQRQSSALGLVARVRENVVAYGPRIALP